SSRRRRVGPASRGRVERRTVWRRFSRDDRGAASLGADLRTGAHARGSAAPRARARRRVAAAARRRKSGGRARAYARRGTAARRVFPAGVRDRSRRRFRGAARHGAGSANALAPGTRHRAGRCGRRAARVAARRRIPRRRGARGLVYRRVPRTFGPGPLRRGARLACRCRRGDPGGRGWSRHRYFGRRARIQPGACQMTTAVILGVGGLGCPAALALAEEAPRVRVILVDPDRVERSNLSRQILFTESDIGEPKAIVAARRLAALVPQVRAEPRVAAFRPGTAADLLTGCDIVLDGTDDFETRFAVNDAACAARIPLVHGAVLGWRGQILTVLPGHRSCLRCLFEGPPPAGAVPTC